MRRIQRLLVPERRRKRRDPNLVLVPAPFDEEVRLELGSWIELDLRELVRELEEDEEGDLLGGEGGIGLGTRWRSEGLVGGEQERRTRALRRVTLARWISEEEELVRLERNPLESSPP